jgi:hypothetical protein
VFHKSKKISRLAELINSFSRIEGLCFMDLSIKKKQREVSSQEKKRVHSMALTLAFNVWLSSSRQPTFRHGLY